MTYVELINRFWQKDLEYSFSSIEVALYVRLLDRCNKLGWKSPFNLSVERLMAQMGLRTKKPFDTARKKLRDAGLLDFANGNGRGCTTEYTIIGVGTSKQSVTKRTPKRGNKFTSLYGEVSESLSGSVSGLVHKTKTRQDKEEANASRASCQSEKKNNNQTDKSSHFSDDGHLHSDDIKVFISGLAGLWHISEDKHVLNWAKLSEFVQNIADQGRLMELQEQFKGYRDYFLYAELSPHKIGKYTGDPNSEPPYSDGTWCDCDWPAKALQRKPRTANILLAAPVRASASPLKNKDWD